MATWIPQNVGNYLHWLLTNGKYPNVRFLGVRGNVAVAIPMGAINERINDNAYLESVFREVDRGKWRFEKLRQSQTIQYAMCQAVSGLYLSPTSPRALSAVELSANRTAWEIVCDPTNGDQCMIRLADTNLAIALIPDSGKAFLIQDDPSPSLLWELSPAGKSSPPSESILSPAMLQKLANYRTVFLLDDSPSMFNTQPWAVVTDAVTTIVDQAIQISALTKFDLWFVDNFQNNTESLKSGGDAKHAMATIKPSKNPSETFRDSIDQILGQAILEKGFWNVIILTDATRTEDGQSFLNRFKKMLRKVRPNSGGIPHYGIGVQLVQFGSKVNFQPIKPNQPTNLICFDTTNYSTPLTNEQLKKILLGAIDSDVNQTLI